MALRRSDVLGFGGFDGRLSPSAEDNDLSYRWLRADRPIHYEPDFVAWHHDWCTRPQLERLYVGYGVGQGVVYGKQLRSGDLFVARYLLSDAASIARGLAARIVRAEGNTPIRGSGCFEDFRPDWPGDGAPGGSRTGCDALFTSERD
jgi:hypothetical protein